MALRLKDRVEGNIRQSDKVNNSLSIQLNSGIATVYDGSAAKSINITPNTIGCKISINGSSVDLTSAKIYAPTAAGTEGYLLRANSSGIPYWSATLPPANGGTGQTSTNAAANAFINALTVGSSTPIGNDYFISQYPGGGTTITTYHRRPISTLVTFMKTQINEVEVGNSTPTNTNVELWVDTSGDSAEAMRADAIKYKTFSIATSAWSGSGPYTYTISATGITANSAILNLTLDAASQTYQKAQLDWETGANKIVLSTATKPTGTISGYLIATDVTVI